MRNRRMSKTSSVINWGNRIILIIFVLLLIAGGIYDEDALFLAAAFAIVVGLFQLVSSIIFNSIIIDKYVRGKVNIYLIFVFTYFVIVYVGGEFLMDDSGLDEEVLIFTAGFVPLALCIFFTYISEVNVKNIEKNKE